ncbi:Y-family DNA polymerase [Brucepastera parasyntrophica]|uniref:Y-family DNA polymerase n=1 Tax=Brucepastera parasyntrophica TaxID=2880008 RepID=UPI0021090AAD|nr:Y-family DNA polymerase [Brucepastera parasyntrophica]ULQ59553.1 Y-family DNA polymerase [Brucepastera parasyntrophica]
MIFHVDANSFYAACEQIFRPDLTGKPVIVLTNNDCIIISLNREAKELGLRRGDVYRDIAEKCSRNGVNVFSSNYTLYADISTRIIGIYNRLCPEVEVYSIDEAFLYFPDWNHMDFTGIAQRIKNTVLRETGVSVSIGIAPSRTLAKFCNGLAKKNSGILSCDEIDMDAELAGCPVSHVWGVGRSKAALLKRHRIVTALDLKQYPLHLAKKYLTITGMKTVQELNGIPAFDQSRYESRQSIGTSKSFSEPLGDIESIKEALASYTQEAVGRLRRQEGAARFVSVFLVTSSDNTGVPRSCGQFSATLGKATSYLPEILGTAVKLLETIFTPGCRYRKVMVCLFGIENDTIIQPDLFEDNAMQKRKQAVMKCFDTINGRYGRNMLHLGYTVPERRPWNMSRKFLSPAYTTNIRDIPKVY